MCLERIQLSPSVMLPTGLQVAPSRCMESPHPFRPLTVLLVDDDRSVRAIVTRFLAKGGVVVITESEGQKALEIGRRYGQAIDLLITDVYMPGQDGIALALELRAVIPDLRVLFIAGSWNPRLEVVTQNGMGCLIEPFTERQLINAVQNLVCAERPVGHPAGTS